MLENIRVVEIRRVLAGPYEAILADLGADVVKVEKPDGGDDARHMGAAFKGGDLAALPRDQCNRRRSRST
jgi:formyl-CoA transferase